MSKFFAFLSRMKYIERWSLMRLTERENIAEHSLLVAWTAHALAVIENKFFGGNFDACRIGMMGAYHETGEVITGDMPSPIKYFSPEIASAYKKVEKKAENRILATLPADLVDDFRALIQPDKEEKKIVKYADRICALIKCEEELTCNNGEFTKARDTIEKELRDYKRASVDYFLDTFVSAFRLTLDDITIENNEEN